MIILSMVAWYNNTENLLWWKTAGELSSAFLNFTTNSI